MEGFDWERRKRRKKTTVPTARLTSARAITSGTARAEAKELKEARKRKSAARKVTGNELCPKLTKQIK